MVLGRYFIFHTGQYAQFTFYGHAILVSVVNNLLRQGHVLLIRQVRTVDHDRREAHVHAGLAQFEAVAVVQVKHDFRMFASQFLGIFNGTFGHIAQQRLVGIVTGTFGNLQDNGALLLGRSLDDSLQLLHVVEVECRDGITALDGTRKHLFGVHET